MLFLVRAPLVAALAPHASFARCKEGSFGEPPRPTGSYVPSMGNIREGCRGRRERQGGSRPAIFEMDGPPDAPAPVPPAPVTTDEPACLSGMPSSSSLADSFSPEAHSWIMVPEHMDATPPTPTHEGNEPLPALAGTEDGVVAATADEALDPSAAPPTTASTPASPNMLRETGDIVAALAVSEILSAESAWPLPLSQTSPPLPSLCDASYGEPPLTPFARDAREARRLGALAFPPAAGKEDGGKLQDGFNACVMDADEGDTESEPDAIDELLDPLVCWGQAWARPLALVAVLFASHAACLLIGVALGKAQSKEASAASAPETSSAFLTRRFSSGAGGTHARLCVA